MLSCPLVQIRGLLMPSEYTSLPWIRDAEAITDGEAIYVKVRIEGSDDVIVVAAGDFHQWCHRMMDYSLDVERQEQDLAAKQADESAAVADEFGGGA
jgi:hypothetical protein